MSKGLFTCSLMSLMVMGGFFAQPQMSVSLRPLTCPHYVIPDKLIPELPINNPTLSFCLPKHIGLGQTYPDKQLNPYRADRKKKVNISLLVHSGF